MRIFSNIPRIMVLGVLSLCVFCGVASAIDLTVVLPGDQVVIVAATPEQTVAQVKETIYTMTSISPLNSSLVYKGKRLDGGRTVSSLKVSNGDTLRLITDVHPAPTTKRKSDLVWVLPVLLVIMGIGALFMRKKRSWEYDGK